MPTVTMLMYIIVFLFGIVVGSFLNVCILRIPAGESIVTAPSHCVSCGKRLRWYELIPLLSYLFLRGRCSGCKSKISPQYPLIEAANGILWVLTAYLFGFTLDAILCALLASALLGVAVIDARTREIPPGMSIAILILGALRTGLDYTNWLSHITGFFAVSVFLLLLYILTRGRGIGGGDVKLMAVCGLFLGWQLNILAFCFGCVLGAVIHLALMALKKAGRVLALGPYLAAGVLLALWWGDAFLNWYLAKFI